MSFEAIEHVLLRVIEYHKKASDYYAQLNAANADERAGMLLRQLIDQQLDQASELQKYIDTAEQKNLSTELQFPTEDNLWHPPSSDLAAPIAIDNVAAAMCEIDNRVLQLYQQLQQEQLPPKLEELFQRLAEQQENIAKQHSFDVQEASDL